MLLSLHASIGLDPTKKQFALSLNLPEIKEAIADATVAALKAHFEKLNAERSKGYTKPGFYQRVADSIESEITPTGIDFTADQPGLHLRFYGGIVRPGKNPSSYSGLPTKWLTIPAIAEAYGKRAADFKGLTFVKFREDLAALKEVSKKSALNASTGKKVRNKFKQTGTQGAYPTRVFFWLVKKTIHKADSSVFPSAEQIESVAGKAAEETIEKGLNE